MSEKLGSERAARKDWQAHTAQAVDYCAAHGGEDMTAAERATYERMVMEAQRAAREHNETK
ncbi:hypothetical protein ACTXL8_14105 [Glutamicibacter arilaitensis]|uniref:hypothetical protein n=1 Tax=Glutamicibacter arilaitensis TaxID=256701 RepID=UPI003FD18E2A